MKLPYSPARNAPTLLIGGVCYQPFEQAFDQRREGRTAWQERMHAANAIARNQQELIARRDAETRRAIAAFQVNNALDDTYESDLDNDLNNRTNDDYNDLYEDVTDDYDVCTHDPLIDLYADEG